MRRSNSPLPAVSARQRQKICIGHLLSSPAAATCSRASLSKSVASLRPEFMAAECKKPAHQLRHCSGSSGVSWVALDAPRSCSTPFSVIGQVAHASRPFAANHSMRPIVCTCTGSISAISTSHPAESASLQLFLKLPHRALTSLSARRHALAAAGRHCDFFACGRGAQRVARQFADHFTHAFSLGSRPSPWPRPECRHRLQASSALNSLRLHQTSIIIHHINAPPQFCRSIYAWPQRIRS